MRKHVAVLALTFATFGAAAARAATPAQPPQAQPGQGTHLLYTTYFYTAGEAIIHGYEKDTSVRIVSLDKSATIWSGKVGPGETANIRTGKGVFGFLADKKASILVGTPSSCPVVGYFVKNREGSFRSDQFFAQLPSSTMFAGRERLLVFAWDDTKFEISDVATKHTLHSGALKKGEMFEISGAELSAISNHVLEFKADKPAIEVEVYYDEGFIVPGEDGRGSGKLFYTYVGDLTTGENDLLLMSYNTKANAKVTDIKTGEVIFSGPVPAGGIVPLTMAKRYVRVTSDVELSVAVAAFKHYVGPYQEHHFAMGAEGTGIDHDFLLNSPEELWIFSYFKDSDIEVTNAQTGKALWKGKLQAGQVQGLTPGFGLYRVRSSKGASVMGGSSACGGEYSPAAGLFSVDETLFKVMKEIQAQRIQEAHDHGVTLTPKQLAAPLSPPEMKQAQKALESPRRSASGNGAAASAPPPVHFTPAEVQQRLDDMRAY